MVWWIHMHCHLWNLVRGHGPGCHFWEHLIALHRGWDLGHMVAVPNWAPRPKVSPSPNAEQVARKSGCFNSASVCSMNRWTSLGLQAQLNNLAAVWSRENCSLFWVFPSSSNKRAFIHPFQYLFIKKEPLSLKNNAEKPHQTNVWFNELS
jgi:hypothetical protein